MKKVNKIIDKACAGIEISDKENEVIVRLNKKHRERCFVCSSKGGFLTPEISQSLDTFFEKYSWGVDIPL